MNPLIQLNRQLQYLFIALLLACFAIAPSAMAQNPNHRVIDLNFTTPEIQCCFMDKVLIEGKVNIFFEHRAGKGVEPTRVTLDPFNAGRGSRSGRNYTGTVEVKNVRAANKLQSRALVVIRLTAQPNPPPQGDPAPGIPTQFAIRYEIHWIWNNGKVGNPFIVRGRELCCVGSGCNDF